MSARVGTAAPNAFVGSPVKRLEDPPLLRGRGRYVDDLSREGMLHAAILRSSVAHGRLRSVDASQARALPGVHAVITAKEIGSPVPVIGLRLWPMQELEPFGQPVIVETKVRYVGEVIAVAVADSPGLAEDALEAIEFDIEPLPAVASREVACADDALLFEESGSNRAITYTATRGDAAAAFEDAPYVRRERFAVQRHSALPMEPRGVLAEWDADQARLTVWGAAKVPFANRRILARLMRLDEQAIEMVEGNVGGGFGARGEFFPEDFLIPFAARYVGRPVKWIEDRREHLLTMGHAREMDCEVEIACRRDGTIIGLRGQVYVDAGAYLRTSGSISPRNVAQFMSGPYRVPNIRINSSVLLTNKAPIGTYRGPGRFETDFFRERLLDLVASDLGIDKMEFRRRNLVTENEMPYPLATISPPEKKEEFDSGDFHTVFQRCLDEFRWSEKRSLEGKLVDGRYHGLAIGCFVEGGAAGPKENAKLVLQDDGTVTVYVGSTAVGQGIQTTLTQIAADALEMPMDRIRLFHGSTAYLTEGFGSYHSRSTVMGGSAILLAAAKFREMIRVAAGKRLGCAASEIEILDGSVVAPDRRSLPLGEFAAGRISIEESFANHRHTYSFGTAAAHVTVDPKTGHVDLVDFLMVEDVGRIVNPLTLHGQAIGSVVQGLGGAFLEHLVYDAEGQLLTGSLADYLVPSATDFPNIKAIMLQLRPSPINPLGVKGGGEGGTIPMGGLMANAVASALSSLGVQPRVLPLSPPRVWEMIEAARSAR
jgi:carbon-monoxide dehydrogenase large subunit